MARSLGALLVLVGGCSLGVTPADDCTSDVQCVQAFGYGSSCEEEAGWCVSTDLDERCSVYPQGLTLPIYLDDVLLIGQMGTTGTDTYTARARASRLAIGEVNEAEGLDGRSFAIVECSTSADDDLTQSEATAKMAAHLSAELGVLAIVGPYSSSDTETAFTTVEPDGTLLITPSATSPALTDLDGSNPTDAEPGLLWRVSPSDALQGRKIAQYLDDRGYSHVGIIYQAGAYGDGLQEVAAEELYERNPDVELELEQFSESSEIEASVADISDKGVEVTLFISSESEDSAAFLLAAEDDGGFACDPDDPTQDFSVLLPDAGASVDVLEAASAASAIFPCVRGTRPEEASGPLFDSFIAAYDNVFDDDPSGYSYTAQSYDAAWLTIYGVTWATYNEPGLQGAALARGLRRVSSGEAVPIRATSWSTVKSAFETGTSIDVVGTSGELDFDPETEETTAPIEIWYVGSDGESIEVE